MAYIFHNISKQASLAGVKPNATDEARDWFRDKAFDMTKVNANKIMSKHPERLKTTMNRNSIGRMFMYFYDPKWKEELPYYDRFPLIFPFHVEGDRFKGINLHYLPPLLRAHLMDALYSKTNNDKMDDTTKLRISYKILKGATKFRYFRPCVKEYLFSHVRSQFLYIPPSEWDIALFLPTERFVKARKQRVWSDSRKAIEAGGGAASGGASSSNFFDMIQGR